MNTDIYLDEKDEEEIENEALEMQGLYVRVSKYERRMLKIIASYRGTRTMSSVARVGIDDQIESFLRNVRPREVTGIYQPSGE